MAKTIFKISGLRFSFGRQPVINGIDLDLEAGLFHGIVGPNGSGKTTLLMLMLGYYRAETGRILFDGKDILSIPRRHLAREIALVPQDFSINFDFSVRDVVMMGRYPYLPRFSPPSREEVQKVSDILREMGISKFADRSILTLSGGEKQWVVFARALVQDTPVLLLDEATSNMDIHHTIYALDRVRQRIRTGKTIIGVFHDLNLAAMYCDRLIFMSNGRIVLEGSTEEAFCEEIIEKTFGVSGTILLHPQTGNKQMMFQKEATL